MVKSKEHKEVSNDLALFLGMFVGDGCLSRKLNGNGYPNYFIGFYNTKKEYVKLFQKLFKKLTGENACIRKVEREGKKDLWQSEKYSKRVFNIINTNWEIPYGKKARIVFIPSFILTGTDDLKKHFS